MKYRSSHEIRNLFLQFFKEKGHMIEPGASLIPINDPTLLWINSGVAALKKYFDGSIKPSNNRIANAQKSIRTNDIENVGKTARHHTFFEMLGNFSIGDYFKEEAIAYAWEFLTSPKWIGFNPDLLYITVHPDDHEAYSIWTLKIGVPENRILKSTENYWQIGEGPCGPNTEIYVDRGDQYDLEGLKERLFFEEIENDRYIEVWNVVFSQYDGKEGIARNEYKELPQKNIDTGLGLERLVCLVQGGETNYDTDLFLPIIFATESMALINYKDNPMAYRVIADHIRTITFALNDGALFSNEGRGYVLRRILRRAVRYGRKIQIKDAFMYHLVQVVADNMKEFYPSLLEKISLLERLVKAEEERFQVTLLDGENLLLQQIKTLPSNVLSGDIAFKLYDTYGFPVELTQEIALEHHVKIDMDGFNQQMEIQRQRARYAREDTESMTSQSEDLINFTNESIFVGYELYEITSTIIGCFKNGVEVDSLEGQGQIILDKTPFYAESGGQIADIGTIHNEVGFASVIDVQRAPNKQALHGITIDSGSLKKGDQVIAKIDSSRRRLIMANHSSAHLLQSALKTIVGSHIQQAGSYVHHDYMRFDFTHYEKVNARQIKAIEKMVNDHIFTGLGVQFAYMNIEEAKQQGATALFDEKYEQVVRVVSIDNVSKELCGGTHVANTMELGLFRIESEESIGSGIRRMVCKTSKKAYQDFLEMQSQLETIATLVKMPTIGQVEKKVAQLLEEYVETKRELDRLNSKINHLKAQKISQEIIKHQDLNVIFSEVEQVDAHGLKLVAEYCKKHVEKHLIFLWSHEVDKVTFVVMASSEAIKQGYHAGELAKVAAVITGGNGGGRPDFAQSGGKDVAKLAHALKMVEEKIGLCL